MIEELHYVILKNSKVFLSALEHCIYKQILGVILECINHYIQ